MRTDNQEAARIVQVGSMKLDLHRIAIDIFSFCFENSIQDRVGCTVDPLYAQPESCCNTPVY